MAVCFMLPSTVASFDDFYYKSCLSSKEKPVMSSVFFKDELRRRLSYILLECSYKPCKMFDILVNGK